MTTKYYIKEDKILSLMGRSRWLDVPELLYKKVVVTKETGEWTGKQHYSFYQSNLYTRADKSAFEEIKSKRLNWMRKMPWELFDSKTMDRVPYSDFNFYHTQIKGTSTNGPYHRVCFGSYNIYLKDFTSLYDQKPNRVSLIIKTYLSYEEIRKYVRSSVKNKLLPGYVEKTITSALKNKQKEGYKEFKIYIKLNEKNLSSEKMFFYLSQVRMIREHPEVVGFFVKMQDNKVFKNDILAFLFTWWFCYIDHHTHIKYYQTRLNKNMDPFCLRGCFKTAVALKTLLNKKESWTEHKIDSAWNLEDTLDMEVDNVKNNRKINNLFDLMQIKDL